jgi:hypothetical protein
MLHLCEKYSFFYRHPLKEIVRNMAVFVRILKEIKKEPIDRNLLNSIFYLQSILEYEY